MSAGKERTELITCT